MPTYAELQAESYWTAEYEAPAHARFNTRLRAHYGHTKAQTGSKGDNRHLRGRHRSRNWCLNSKYCTDRSYATTDPRDKRGDGDWLRATDIGIQGTELRAASKRLDTAVRAGLLPCVAEWFGTIDGSNVVGWYEGHASSSDDSHLWHLHVGLWTEQCDNTPQLDLLYQVITGEDDMDAKTFLGLLKDPAVSAYLRALPLQYPVEKDKSLLALYREMAAKVDLIAGKVDIDPAELEAVTAAANAGAQAGVLASADALADALAAKLPDLDADRVRDALREIIDSGTEPAGAGAVAADGL